MFKFLKVFKKIDRTSKRLVADRNIEKFSKMGYVKSKDFSKNTKDLTLMERKAK